MENKIDSWKMHLNQSDVPTVFLIVNARESQNVESVRIRSVFNTDKFYFIVQVKEMKEVNICIAENPWYELPFVLQIRFALLLYSGNVHLLSSGLL